MNGEEQAAEYLKDQLTVLGPAFVKIGQAVASRPDVVAPVYIRQLEYLQARPRPSRSLTASSTHVVIIVAALNSCSCGYLGVICWYTACQ